MVVWTVTSRKSYTNLGMGRCIRSDRGPIHSSRMWQQDCIRSGGMMSSSTLGMSSRGLSAAEIEAKTLSGQRKRALYSRLESHASGRRSGDQFCLYVYDYYIVPELSKDELEQIRHGAISLDQRTKQFIRSQLIYRFVAVAAGDVALRIETYIKREGLRGSKPRLNPM